MPCNTFVFIFHSVSDSVSGILSIFFCVLWMKKILGLIRKYKQMTWDLLVIKFYKVLITGNLDAAANFQVVDLRRN